MCCALFGGALWKRAVGTDLDDARGPLRAGRYFRRRLRAPLCVEHAERVDRGCRGNAHAMGFQGPRRPLSAAVWDRRERKQRAVGYGSY